MQEVYFRAVVDLLLTEFQNEIATTLDSKQ